MDFLPPIDIRDVADEEDTGDFVACRFSDDEEDEHGDDCECVLCSYGDGGSGEAHAVLERMQEIDQQLVGKVSDDEIHRLQAELYTTHVLEPSNVRVSRTSLRSPRRCVVNILASIV